MRFRIVTALVVAFPLSAWAQSWPHNEGPMEHVLITLDSDTQTLTVTPPEVDEALPLRCFAGETYDPPADVLSGACYNDQYGWLPGGFISLPPDSAIWIEVVDPSAELGTYEGGMRSMTPTHSYDPLFGTDGSPERWMWDGTMMHNWYAATTPGPHTATYHVYVGDLSGNPLPGYIGDEVTLAWSLGSEPTPAASTWGLIVMALMMVTAAHLMLQRGTTGATIRKGGAR